MRLFYLFAGKQKKGGLQDYAGAHYSVDECLAAAAALPAGSWWEIAVALDDGLSVVQEGRNEKNSQLPTPKSQNEDAAE